MVPSQREPHQQGWSRRAASPGQTRDIVDRSCRVASLALTVGTAPEVSWTSYGQCEIVSVAKMGICETVPVSGDLRSQTEGALGLSFEIECAGFHERPIEEYGLQPDRGPKTTFRLPHPIVVASHRTW
jgi:hypothetical protein